MILPDTVTVELTTGAKVSGTILEETNSYIKIKTEGGVEGKLEKRFIQNIQREKTSAYSVLEDAEKEFALPESSIENQIKNEGSSSKPVPEELPPLADFPKEAPKIKNELPKVIETVEAEPIKEFQEVSNPKPTEEKKTPKNHKLEILVGMGLGRYQSPGEKFTDRYQDIELNTRAQFISWPLHTGSRERLSNSFELNYYWKILSASLEYNQFRSETVHENSGFRAAGLTGFTNPFSSKGSFPESQNITKGDLALLVYSNSFIQVRPFAGMLQSEGSLNDQNSLYTMLNIGTSSLPFSGIQHRQISEHMKGWISGLKLSFPLSNNWELRLESYFISLRGNRNYDAFNPIAALQPDLVTPGESTFFLSIISERVKWKSKGNYLGFQVFYHYNNGISVWLGVSSFEWRYSVETLSNISTSWQLITSEELNRQAFLNLVAKSGNPITRSQSVEVGLMRRFEF